MTPAFSSRRLALLAALASTVLLAACGGGGGDGPGNTSLRAINLTTDLPSVDISTSGTSRFTALAVDTVAPAITLEANTYSMQLSRTGNPQTLLTREFSLSKDQNYTAVVWGRETAPNISALSEDEPLADSVPTSTARLRFFNATTDTGALDIYIGAANIDLGSAQPIQGALNSGGLSGFRDIPSGPQRLRVTGAGDPNDVRLDIPNFNLGGRKIATLVLTAGAGGILVNGTLIEQRGPVTTLKNANARVRMVASVANAGNISASLGTSTLVGALRSPGVGPYTLVPAGDQNLTVRVNGAVISNATRNFAPGADYTVLAYGAENAGTVSLITDDNRLPGQNTRAKIRLVNGLTLGEPITMQIDFLTQTATSDIVAGTGSAYATTAAAGSNRLDITAPTSADPLFSLTAASGANLFQPQGVYTVFMLGGQSNPAGRLSRDR
ncbi:hypothetical protein D621_11810 [beta proteobacterium AAP51]|nr:hypothetical protein D621_11810 [beta proteobacterium AAP51]